METARDVLREALALVVHRGRAHLGRDHRLHPRPGRRRTSDRRLHLRHLLRHRRHRPDVRHHSRPRQCRSVHPGDDDARRLGRHEDHGHAGPDDPDRASRRARLRPRRRHLQLRPDPDPSHPADHRDAVVELRHPLGRDRLWPRPAHQAAAAPRRVHHGPGRRRAGARRLRRDPRRRDGRRPPPHGLRPLGHSPSARARAPLISPASGSSGSASSPT